MEYTLLTIDYCWEIIHIVNDNISDFEESIDPLDYMVQMKNKYLNLKWFAQYLYLHVFISFLCLYLNWVLSNYSSSFSWLYKSFFTCKYKESYKLIWLKYFYLIHSAPNSKRQKQLELESKSLSYSKYSFLAHPKYKQRLNFIQYILNWQSHDQHSTWGT